MDIEAYFKSLSSECSTLKNRVRMLIENKHWPTDGEWKESVLRNMIRRSSPDNLTVGRGFVVNREQCSTQIDVLVYDNTLPVLYKEGDLVFVTPSSCRAIIEVKSRLTAKQLGIAAKKLADNAEFIRTQGVETSLFTGLFTYEVQSSKAKRFLQETKEASDGNRLRIINHAALGESDFIKYWKINPIEEDIMPYDHWHLYSLEQMSFGYFIHNLLTELSRNPAETLEPSWFPTESKEANLVQSLKFEEASN